MRRYQLLTHVCLKVSSRPFTPLKPGDPSPRSVSEVDDRLKVPSEMFRLWFVFAVGLFHRSRGENNPSLLGVPLLHGPSEVLVKQVVDFGCEVLDYPENETIHLQIYKAGRREKLLGESTHQPGKVGIMPMVIKESYEGFLECVAKPLNASSNINATVSSPHYLKVVVPVKNVEIEHSGPPEIFEGKTLELRCRIQAGNHVSYRWTLNDRIISPSPLRRVAEDRLTLLRVSSGDSGFYACVASNTFNKTFFTSHSSELEVKVKELVSDPDISFTVLKEGDSFSALVSCQAARGAPPVTFTLYNGTEALSSVTVDDRQATFAVPLVVRRFLGWIQCRANNSDRIEHSQWLPLRVVPVKGPVTLHYDKDIGENYAAVGLRFYCKAAEGTHPRYRWFLNRTLLQNRGSFYYTLEQPERSVLLLSVGESSAGTYRCEVSDDFDNATAIRSKMEYIDKKVLNRLPTLLVVVVFGCFATVVLLVSVCCCIGVTRRLRMNGEKSPLTLETKGTAAFEGEMEPSAYEEDHEVVRSASEEDFDEESEASVDELI